MDTVGQICTHVSRQMNDQRKNKKFTRWTRQDWLDYLNQGLKEIGAYRPDAYTSTTKITLVAGAVQHAPEGVVINSFGPDQNGNMSTSADADAYKAFMAFSKCKEKPEVVNGKIVYAVKSIVQDKDNPTTFYVSPPVPPGVSVTVEAETVGQPPEYTLADWNKPVNIASKYFNNLLDYMRARAYQLDSESQVSQATSQRLLQLFYQTMGAKYKIDAAQNSGFYKGDIGTGDPRARQ